MRKLICFLIVIALCFLVSCSNTDIEGTYFKVGYTSSYFTFEKSEVSRGEYGGTAKDREEKLINWYVDDGHIYINEVDYLIDNYFLVENKVIKGEEIPESGYFSGTYAFEKATKPYYTSTGEIDKINFNNDGTCTKIIIYSQDYTEEVKCKYSRDENLITIVREDSYKEYAYVIDGKLYYGDIYRK